MFCTIEAYIDRHEALRQQSEVLVHTKRYGNIQTRTLLTGASNARDIKSRLGPIDQYLA